EDVAAELVRPEQMLRRGSLRGGEVLRERVGRCDQRREDRDDEPGSRDHRAGDGERLAPRGPNERGAAAAQTTGQNELLGHVIRILGSITPYSTSTTKLIVMYTMATNRLTPAIAGTSRLTAAWYAYWPMPGQEKIFSTRTAPVRTFAKTSPSTVTTDGRAARRMCRTTTIRSGIPFARAART